MFSLRPGLGREGLINALKFVQYQKRNLATISFLQIITP